MKKILLGVACACSTLAYSQTSPSDMKAGEALPSISREVVANKPLSLVGPRGALLGQQDGGFEAWIFPWKILDNMRLSVNMQDYPVPISVNAHAAQIDVQPDATTITYSHANFTIRQQGIQAPSAQLGGTAGERRPGQGGSQGAGQDDPTGMPAAPERTRSSRQLDHEHPPRGPPAANDSRNAFLDPLTPYLTSGFRLNA